MFEMNQRESKRSMEQLGATEHTKFSDPLDARNVYTLVAVDPKSGNIVGSMTGRITAELQLVVDHEAVAPRSILAAINRLWEDMRPLLWSQGIAECFAPVAPFHKGFIKALLRQKFHYNLKFKKDDRVNFIYDIRADYEK